MERRRTDRKAQLEAIFLLGYAILRNTWNCRTSESTYPPNDGKGLGAVNGPKVTDSALIGQASCANPVENIPANRTKNIISGHDVYLALLFHAVNKLARGVLAYLERAELQAANRGERWEAEDLRVAQQTVALASEGKADPYTLAFYQLYAIHPSKVTSWWRDTRKLAQICERANCPTPLLVREAGRYLEIIPDYDPEVGRVGAAVERGNVPLGESDGQQRETRQGRARADREAS